MTIELGIQSGKQAHIHFVFGFLRQWKAIVNPIDRPRAARFSFAVVFHFEKLRLCFPCTPARSLV
jgi:ADP-dependent phosphofructokinase/glucokinase